MYYAYVCIIASSVNVRLLGERLEQNNEEKPNGRESQVARWPASESCPSCWREDDSWVDNRMGCTCGLWQLFHVASAGAVEYNQHNQDAPIPTRHASETLRNCE